MQIFGCEWEKTNFWWGKEEKSGARGQILKSAEGDRDRWEKEGKGGQTGGKRVQKGGKGTERGREEGGDKGSLQELK